MRTFFCALIFFFISGIINSQPVPPVPDPPRLVNDFANILSSNEKEMLENKLLAYNDSTSTQIVIVTMRDLAGTPVKMMADLIGIKWKVGQKEKNNGLVLLIKPKQNDQKGEIAISTGYGLEPYVTDALSKRIIEQEIIPYFKQNEYYKGINAGVDAIILACKGQYKGNKKNNQSSNGSIALAIIFLLFFIFIFIGVATSKTRYKSISSKGVDDAAFWLMMMSMMSGNSRSSKNSGWGHFSSGSGSFGGFGGGSFGGGGASGSW